MRINLVAGPGAGKSTTAARLFADLKMRNRSVEHVGEYVKAWAYQKRSVNRFDQLYIFGKQHQYEYRFLSQGVKNIVTDSPVILSAFYAPIDLRRPIEQLVEAYDNEYKPMYIFLDRGNKKYIQDGRYQTAEQAKCLDGEMCEFVYDYCQRNALPFIRHKFSNYTKILATVCDGIEQ